MFCLRNSSINTFKTLDISNTLNMEEDKMCYTGGPRCDDGAAKSLKVAKAKVAADPTPQNVEALKTAKIVALLTPAGIKSLEKTNPEKAAFLQKHYDQAVVEAKKYSRYAKNGRQEVKRLEKESKENATAFKENNEKLSQWRNYDNQLRSKGDSPESLLRKKATAEVVNHAAKNEILLSDGKRIAEYKKTMETSLAENLDRRKNGLPVKHSDMMPEKFAGYFADTERKHFNESSSGSTFTELNNLNDVLSAATEQRGSLKGDDREKLIAKGADPSSFGADKRYLMVNTGGKLGTALSSELPPGSMVTVTQKSEKSKPVCSAEVTHQSTTDHATIVLVDKPSLPGTESSPTLLITAYPGVSGPSGSNNDLLPYVGKSMTVEAARKIYGREFTVNTVLKK